MRRAFLAVLVFAAACAAPRGGAPGSASAPAAPARPSRPLFAAAPEVKDPNFILVVTEAVPDPSNDGISYTKVFVDGREAGRTEVGRKSEEHLLKLKLPAGNQPVRLEHWILPGIGDWTRLDDAFQPRERFVRIEDGTVVRVELHFSEGEGSNTLALKREAAAP
jgi:hypothetical protein